MSKVDVINEIHKCARVNFPRRQVVLKDIDDLWQADLMDMQAISKVNGGYKYILAVIDTFSKYAWTVPLKQKNKQQVSTAFESLCLKGRVPRNLQTDLGKEFYNEKFKNIVTKYKINHYSTYSTKKASIVERLIRTLKNKLYKEFSLIGSYQWMNGTLNKIVNEYNNTTHRTVGQPPASINHNNKTSIMQRYIKMAKCKKSDKYRKLSVGDFVRISKYKGCFDKGYYPNWSTEIFKIKTIQETKPVTYLIEDARCRPILGAFYAQELQKTNHPDLYLVEKVLKRKGNQVYVKWLGLPTGENSWIDKTNVF